MSQKTTLREVAAILESRLKATPLKYYWREEKNGHLIDTKGFEVTYKDLTPTQVKKAMDGIKLVQRAKYKDRPYKWLLRWEHKSEGFQFRATLYVYEDGMRHFIFTTVF